MALHKECWAASGSWWRAAAGRGAVGGWRGRRVAGGDVLGLAGTRRVTRPLCMDLAWVRGLTLLRLSTPKTCAARQVLPAELTTYYSQNQNCFSHTAEHS